MTDLLRAEGVSAFYGASQILFDIDLALQEKRTLALLGRNGAGKSTTMKTLAGIVRAPNSASPMCLRTGRCFRNTAWRTIS
jgi:branched-chain amino acid transport system ATP-binding protein